MKIDGTKRFRVLTFDFDARANLLAIEIKPDWEPHVQEVNRQSQKQVIEGILAEYGPLGGERKIADFRSFGIVPWSVVAFHNIFFRQIQASFVSGAYYPALTGACALGERILNHLVLKLRDFFKSTPEYKRVWNKDSFDNWDTAIDTLAVWGVFRDEVVATYRDLRDARHQAIHFRPEVDSNTRELSLKACKLLSAVIDRQFGATGRLPWFIPNKNGIPFIARDAENQPFIRVVYLPNCVRVGPLHRLDHRGGRFVVAKDPELDGVPDLTDSAFVEWYEKNKGR